MIILKLYYYIASKLALPNQILAVTFTNKAANELKNRVTKMTGKKIDSWWIGTFHSVSARILRRYFNEVGLKENFVIIDKEDQIKIIKNICENEKIDSDKKNPKYFLKCIDQFKNENLTVEKVLNDAKDIDEKNVANIYAIYEDELKHWSILLNAFNLLVF